MEIIRLLDSGRAAVPEPKGKPWHEFRKGELFARRDRPPECFMRCYDGAQMLIDVAGFMHDVPLVWSPEEMRVRTNFADCIPAAYRITSPLTLERIN